MANNEVRRIAISGSMINLMHRTFFTCHTNNINPSEMIAKPSCRFNKYDIGIDRAVEIRNLHATPTK